MTKEQGYCFKCCKEVGYVRKEKTVQTIVKGKKVSFPYIYCECIHCGELVVDNRVETENDIRMFDAYKREVGLLTSCEIKAIRKKYGLSAEDFALKLRLGAKTITRYETGSIQSAQVDLLIRLADRQGESFFLEEGSGGQSHHQG